MEEITVAKATDGHRSYGHGCDYGHGYDYGYGYDYGHGYRKYLQ